MKLTVIGAGTIGSTIAYDLCRADGVTRVEICDASSGALDAAEERVASPKLRTHQINARDLNALTPVFKGSACVISCAAPELNPALARLALNVGTHFCDLGGSDPIVQDELTLAKTAREKGVWIVPNCGLAPGLINILCLHAVEQFDQVEEAHLRVGGVAQEPKPPFNFHLGYSVEKLLEDYSQPVPVIAEGALSYAEPLTQVERISFPEPFGEMEAFLCGGGLSTLPQDLAGKVKCLDYKKIRYPGHAAQMKLLFDLGLADKRMIDVRTHLSYRDLLIRQMRKYMDREQPDAVLLRVYASGVKDGVQKTLTYEMLDLYDAAAGFTAVRRSTAFPAAVVALLLASKQVPGGGAAPPEHVVPFEPFLDALRQRGLHVIETWQDGPPDFVGVSPAMAHEG